MYKLELTINTDENAHRPFIYEQMLNRREYAKFEFNKRKFLEKALEKAHRVLAVKEGYIPQVYGKDYYKLVRIRTWSYKFTEMTNDKVVAQGIGH